VGWDRPCMGWDGNIISWQPAVARLRMASHIWLCSGVGTPPARVCSSVPGVWLHLCMKLGIHRLCVPWVEGRMRSRFMYGQFRCAITGGVCVSACVAWRELCQQAYMHVCISVVRQRTLSPYIGLWPPCLWVWRCSCNIACVVLAWWRTVGVLG